MPNDSFFGSLVVVVDIVLILSKTVDSVRLVNKINYSRGMSFKLMTSYIFTCLSDREPLLIDSLELFECHVNLITLIYLGHPKKAKTSFVLYRY